MCRLRQLRCTAVLVVLGLVALPTTALAQDQAEAAAKTAKVSQFAKAKDVETELRFFIDKIGKDLANKEEFGEDQQTRISLDGSTVAVLGLTLALHDEKSDLKPAASKVVELAAELVENAESFADATTTYSKLQAALTNNPKTSTDAELSWDAPVADIVLLMKQVPIVNDKVRRGVNDKRRFKRNAKKTAQKAVTLAAIAHISMMNTDYCGDEDDEKAWKKICVDMRDACADIYTALMENDQAKAKAGNKRVVESCDACHHRFRD